MQLHKLAAYLVASFSLMSVAHAQSAPALDAPAMQAPGMQQARSVTGTYTSTWGVTTLVQAGDHISGSYAFRGGQIDGTIDNGTVRFTWREAGGATGRGVFMLAPDGELVGTWGNNNDEQNGGVWRLTPAAAGVAAPTIANLCACTTTAVADPVVATAPSGAGSWTFDIRFPWDVTLTPGNVGVGMGGVGLDVGRRMTDRWYLGASADWENVMQIGTGASDSLGDANRFRVGGEARYNFHDGTSSVSVNDGPYYDVPRHDWIGFRAGAETLDGFNTLGQFADVTLGMDSQVSPGLRMGLYVSAGASFEPSSAYSSLAAPTTATGPSYGTADVSEPTEMSASGSSTTRSTYFTLGMSLGFG